jgi:hypothetical protein
MTGIADVPGAASASVAALAGYTDLDWQQVPAADLQWSCWQTTLHMVDCLYFYACQVVYGNPDGYLCTELALDDSASPPRLLAALSAHAELLHRIALSADPDLRAHHNYGVSDAAGFAAMGVVETLIHTFDVVRGLNPSRPVAPVGRACGAGDCPAVSAGSRWRCRRCVAVPVRPRRPGRAAPANSRMAVGRDGRALMARRCRARVAWPATT